MKKPLLLVGFLSVIVIVLAIVRITIVNSMSTTGKNLVAIQNKTAALQRENKVLKEKYLQAASFTTIDKKAVQMGFSPSKSQLNIAAPLPLALR